MLTGSGKTCSTLLLSWYLSEIITLWYLAIDQLDDIIAFRFVTLMGPKFINVVNNFRVKVGYTVFAGFIYEVY